MVNVVECFPNFKFGCDPELFVINTEGELVSAAGLIPGTKEQPHKVDNGAVQVDGMAFEFNIDPVSTFEDWDKNITSVMKQGKAMLPKGYSFATTPSAIFTDKVWAETPEIAKELGCTPDFNAWTGEVNPPPGVPDAPTLRCAGGHIHFGWTEGAEITDSTHLMNCQDLVKQLDWYLGGWSLNVDTDHNRRRLYGKAGACRYKPYGVEYRTLSNFWVHSKEMRREVWNRMNQAIWDMRGNNMPESPTVKQYKFNELLIESINSSSLSNKLVRNFPYPLYKCN